MNNDFEVLELSLQYMHFKRACSWLALFSILVDSFLLLISVVVFSYKIY